MARPGIRRITALLLAFLILGSAAAAIYSFLRERERDCRWRQPAGSGLRFKARAQR
jgi:hypothetical protein